MNEDIFFLLKEASRELKVVSSSPFFESQCLLSSVENCLMEDLLFKKQVSSQSKKKFLNQVKLRKTGCPLDYLLGKREFFKCFFHVGEGVFLPRKETEQMVALVLKYWKNKSFKGVDFGSGTGCIPIALAKESEGARFLAVEKSKQAFLFLKKNQKAFQMEKRVFICHKSVEAVTAQDMISFLKEAPDVITANPPYICKKDKELDLSVKDFEPATALFSDHEGVFHIYSWFQKAMELLKPGGMYIFEIGYSQGEKVCDFLNSQKEISSYKVYKDFQGWDRTVICFKKAGKMQ